MFLIKYLYENTNEDHEISTGELIEVLEENGINNQNQYSWGKREFDIPELKLLIDAVSSAQFISSKQSKVLIDKLIETACVYDRERLKARIYPSERIKANNKQLFYIVEQINKAIDTGKNIRFKYYELGKNRQLVEKNNGEEYINSPYAMIWNDDRYYLLGYSDKYEKIVTLNVMSA